MYNPKVFREDRLDLLHAMMRAHPLATLVTSGRHGLMANLVPFSLSEEGDKGTLCAHVARGNSQLGALREGEEALVIFQGPEAYITPSWYASKAENGEAVPTWNYTMVQARGIPRVIEDHAWLRTQVEALTDAQESMRSDPWRVSDAPEGFITSLLNGIVGIEIPIDHLEGKWKVSQNRSEGDRQGVQEGLRHEKVCDAMAALVAERGS